jgi:hypothetical protein
MSPHSLGRRYRLYQHCDRLMDHQGSVIMNIGSLLLTTLTIVAFVQIQNDSFQRSCHSTGFASSICVYEVDTVLPAQTAKRVT